jgi:GNAT superfamily N-acetyltransferase
MRCNRAGSRASLELAVGSACCEVAREAGAIAGVLIADPPGARPPPTPRIATQLRCLAVQGWGVARRWNAVHFELRRLRPAEPHWYLDLLGIEPGSQRRGLGSALLGRLLERVDEDGAPSYLETDRRENLPFYARAGYQLVAEERVLGTPVWRLWRPRSPRGGSDVR